MRKLQAPKVKGSRTQKKQTIECYEANSQTVKNFLLFCTIEWYKANSQTLKNFLLCCSIVIRVLK
jgi:hypothetical protein